MHKYICSYIYIYQEISIFLYPIWKYTYEGFPPPSPPPIPPRRLCLRNDACLQKLQFFSKAVTIEFHINVEPSTNATDNTITVASNITGNVKQSSINISEYNTFNNLGAPQLVNVSGTLVAL